MFNVTYPENPVYEGVVPGTYLGVADGYFVILEPLPVGEHDLHIMLTKLNPPKGSSMCSTPSIAHDIKYHLTVK